MKSVTVYNLRKYLLRTTLKQANNRRGVFAAGLINKLLLLSQRLSFRIFRSGSTGDLDPSIARAPFAKAASFN